MKYTLTLLTALLLAPLAGLRAGEAKIDRHALVTRHNVTLTSFDPSAPRNKQSVLQVGNGHFAFGMDVTGLQTFMLHGSFSHATLSDWCWHTTANPERYRPEETETAKRQAARQGYKGVRWMKMIAPTAEWESPSDAGPFRMTQQGHAIYWAEEMYRARSTRETLEQFREIVMQSAEFMVDYLWWDEKSDRYVLGPPLLTGSEASNWRTTCNSTVELSYWFYGLRTAQLWRERLGLPREAKWDEVLAKLTKPPVVDGLCVDAETAICPARYQPAKGKFLPRPAWFEAYGCMRGDEVDKAAMSRTFDKIWNETQEGYQWMFWGCDFPMMAMTAARLGRPKEAVDALLHPGNTYLENGFNNLGSPPYLPASGGFLWATAMMAAGWDGCPDKHAPGFPDDDSWTVKWEGLKKAQ